MAGVELFPKEYGYVILVRVFYCFLKFWMSFQVGKARKKYKLSYPTMYAIEAENKNAKLFNCVQIVGGIRHPLICASLGAVYSVCRFFYFTGYFTGDPQNRLTIGKYNFLAIMGLMICSISCGVDLLMS